MSETMNRVLVAGGLLAVAMVAWFMERGGMPAIYWLCLIIGAWMIFEFLRVMWRAPREVMFNGKNLVVFIVFLGLLCADFMSLMTLGRRPMMILMILVIVCAADVCAWLFGRIIGGDKMWEKISEHKTWAGQIFGIIGGTVAGVLYGHIVMGGFVPQMVWIGISIALLSQYGDLTASFIKRRLRIKDFSNVLGKHGGIIDRFDGWIYVLPVIWAVLA
ncbi:MAG: CDP-archaeol synthase [Alphaproteobacteria bacterium]|nr:CDP-archaeol synthase [Alphaproteobacteria bacterium]